MMLLRLPKIILLLLLILMVSGSIILAQDSQLNTNGLLDNDTPFLEIPLIVEESNSTIILDMQATSGDLDTLLYLVDINGNIVAENDDRANGNTDSLLRFPQPNIGSYTVIATRYGVVDGNTSGEFELIIDVSPAQIETHDYALTEDDLLAVGYPAIVPHEEAEWTILAYYGGDTNLESGIINDFDEFEVAGGSDESVRIIMLVDRHPDFTDVDGDWDSVRLFEVSADISEDHDTAYPPSLDSEPLADLGELDMGSGETLAQFLTWGIQNYPAKHYAVAFASHGAGWQGLITDDSSIGGTTILAIPELKQAFNSVMDIADGEKFDLLINDACLMSSVEYHTSMASYFEQSLASPEVVVNPALDMSLFVNGIRANPMLDLTELGTQLVDTYMTRDTEGVGAQPYLTSALTNLNNFSTVSEATEHFAAIVNADPARFVTMLGLARSNAYTYTAFLGNNTLIDTGHFMEQVIINSNDIQLINAAQAVLEALNLARVHGNAGEEAARWSSYYNIYFPENSSDFERRYFDESPLQEWGRMLQAYYNLVTPRLWAVEDSLLIYHPPIAPKVSVTQVYPEVSSFVAPPTIRMEILGRNLSFGNFTVDQIQADGTAIRFLSKPILTEVVIGERVDLVNQWRSGVDQSQFSWLPMTLPVVTDGTVYANELLIRSDELAILEGRYRESGSETWHNVAVFFSIEERTVKQIISRSEESGALAAIDIAEGSEFQSYRQLVTADGRVILEPGTLYTWGDLRWFDDSAPSGQYNLGFFVQAHGGISGFDSVTITVSNDGLDTNLRGYVDVNLGLNFRYPSDWITPFDTGSQIVTGNLANTSNIAVSYFNADLDNAWKIAEDFQILYGLAADGFGTEIQFNNQMAVKFSYNYLQGETVWHGQALALFQKTDLDNTGTGIVFSVEATSQEEASAQYSDLVTYLEIFNALDLAAQDLGQWRYRFIQPGIAHPVPADWLSVIGTQAGEWTTFTSPNSAETYASFSYYHSASVDEIVESLIHNNLPENYDLATYLNDNKTWQIIQYTTGEDESLVGRYYVAEINNQVYTLWFETLNNENAVSTIRNLFEPMVDGFAPQNSVQYALGGLNPAILKAVMTRAILTCGEIDPDDACYGEGSLILRTVQGVDEDDENFGNPGDIVQVTGIEEMTVGILEDQNDTFDSYSIGVIELEIPLEEIIDEAIVNGVRMGIFGGIAVTNGTTLVDPNESSEE